jgi:hypothetical protein
VATGRMTGGGGPVGGIRAVAGEAPNRPPDSDSASLESLSTPRGGGRTAGAGVGAAAGVGLGATPNSPPSSSSSLSLAAAVRVTVGAGRRAGVLCAAGGGWDAVAAAGREPADVGFAPKSAPASLVSLSSSAPASRGSGCGCAPHGHMARRHRSHLVRVRAPGRLATRRQERRRRARWAGPSACGSHLAWRGWSPRNVVFAAAPQKVVFDAVRVPTVTAGVLVHSRRVYQLPPPLCWYINLVDALPWSLGHLAFGYTCQQPSAANRQQRHRSITDHQPSRVVRQRQLPLQLPPAAARVLTQSPSPLGPAAERRHHLTRQVVIPQITRMAQIGHRSSAPALASRSHRARSARRCEPRGGRDATAVTASSHLDVGERWAGQCSCSSHWRRPGRCPTFAPRISRLHVSVRGCTGSKPVPRRSADRRLGSRAH